MAMFDSVLPSRFWLKGATAYCILRQLMQTPTAAESFKSVAPLVALLTVVLLINYVDRGSLSIAAPLLQQELRFSTQQLGLLFSAFFGTYTVFIFVSGWLVDRFDVAWVLAGGFAVWSVATAATGLVNGFAALLVMRLLLGIGESVAFPAMATIIARYVPERFTGLVNGMCMAGVKAGPAVGAIGTGLLMARFGWRPVFIALGLTSFLWIPLWLLYRPRKEIRSQTVAHTRVTVHAILAQRSFWGTAFGHFTVIYLLYFMVSWLPLYLAQERHLSLRAMAVTAATYYSLDALFAAVAGHVTDLLIRQGRPVTQTRKMAMYGGQFVAAAGLIGIAMAGQRTYLAWLAVIALGSGVSGSGIYVFSQILAGPEAAGRWAGFQNGFANLSGVVGPAFTGFLVARSGHFTWALYVTATVSVLGAISWIWLVGPLQQTRWAATAPDAPLSLSSTNRRLNDCDTACQAQPH